MKIVGINASYRGSRGTTGFLLSQLIGGAASEGAEVETLTLANYKINRCLGCEACQMKATCVYEQRDDARLLFDVMSTADVIIYATPAYRLGMSTLLKTLFDRTYAETQIAKHQTANFGAPQFKPPGYLHKPFVPLITCSEFDLTTPSALRLFFRNYATFNEAEQVGELVRNMATYFPSKAEGIDKEPAFRSIPTVLEAYQRAGGELARRGFIDPITQRRANRELPDVPFFRLLKRFRALRHAVLNSAEQRMTTAAS